MSQNPYEVLKLTPDASMEDIEQAYQKLKAQYSEDRFLEGEAGRQGAINLMNLENAYSEIINMRKKQQARIEYGSNLGDIDQMIKDGKIDQAQIELDKMSERTAHWHFLQSIIFYKKGWYDESRAQLKLALNLDPNNTQYQTALSRLEQVMASSNANPYTMGTQQTQGQGQDQPMPPDASMGLANCCTTLCLLDCCCNLMRCC
ncbi:MAG TPA: hypothetical protein GX745_03805 [Clostridiales bacterium]|nr:hypothetical protein [Clostridiales bacterium]